MPHRVAQRHRRQRAGATAIAVLVVGALGGCDNHTATVRSPPVSSAPPAATTASTPSSPAATNPTARQAPRVTAAPADRRQATSRTALALLATLVVKGRAPMTGYRRALFGSAWTDDNDDPLGHNGCDSRNDILRRDLAATTIKAGSQGCTVLTGTLADPYTATTIGFTRGRATSSAVQIDHVVALGDAWQSGAQQWDSARRVDLANDPLNLLAVDGHSNEQKGDANAASWLPPNTAYRCAYVARQVAVKARYGLSVTAAESDAIVHVLARCPAQPAPGEVGTPAAQPAPAPAPTTQAAPTPPPPAHAYYANCAAARAAGKAPLYRGQPGYRAALDRDDDGVACE
jgi:hypothetical protein